MYDMHNITYNDLDVGKHILNFLNLRETRSENVKIILRYKMHPRARFEESTFKCGANTCMITNNASYLKQASALIFNPLHSPLPDYRSTQQYWVMYYQEAPTRFPAKQWHDGKFNLTMSYHRKAGDVYAPYLMTYKLDGTPKNIPNVHGRLLSNSPRGPMECLPKLPYNKTDENRNVTRVFWFNSNCVSTQRKRYE